MDYYYNPQPVPRTWFSHIEKALDIELTDNQKYCLFNGIYPNWGGRRNGKTICDCIQLSLSVGEPINKLTIFGDDDPMFPHEYARILTDVNMKLYDYGFNTRRIGSFGGWHGFNYSNKKEQ